MVSSNSGHRRSGEGREEVDGTLKGVSGPAFEALLPDVVNTDIPSHTGSLERRTWAKGL